MSQGKQSRANEWMAYYHQFDYFSPELIREDCHPRLMLQPEPAQKAIVLVHGLSDSPYFMSAIGDYFFKTLKYDVYIPLLHFHGLNKPQGMEGVNLVQWKANVRYAVDEAAKRSGQVSIGGLSTGGTLSFHNAASRETSITGSLYLFSAALDLAGGVVGDFKEWLLRKKFLVDIFDKNKPLIGAHPYKYLHVDLDGARELAELIDESDALIDKFRQGEPFQVKTFAAHSEADETANIAGIEDLQAVSNPRTFTFYRLPESKGVGHASLVLKDHVLNVEDPNPLFDDMMAAIKSFAAQD